MRGKKARALRRAQPPRPVLPAKELRKIELERDQTLSALQREYQAKVSNTVAEWRTLRAAATRRYELQKQQLAARVAKS